MPGRSLPAGPAAKRGGAAAQADRSGAGAARRTVAGGATIRELLSFRLHVVANLLSRGAALRYKREFGVSLMEWRTLALLGGGAPLSLNELAKLAGLDKSQMSRVVAGLSERSLISRAVDSSDARGVQLSLSSAGQKVYAGLIAAANERDQAFIASLDAAELAAFESVLDKLGSTARDFIHAENAAGKAGAGNSKGAHLAGAARKAGRASKVASTSKTSGTSKTSKDKRSGS